MRAHTLAPWHDDGWRVIELLRWLMSDDAAEMAQEDRHSDLCYFDDFAEADYLLEKPWKYGPEWLAFQEWKARKLAEAQS